jgi:hypothetical protein
MQLKRALEQQIAVFGESGSGKTVLLSSFYGATQDPKFIQKSLFNVVPDDIGQGSRLHQNYLRMRNSSRTPETNKFSATSYSFSIKLKDGSPKAMKARPFDALRLVWHDYPGQWFEQDVSGPEEAQRRVNAFKSLLGSDVALVLVDGQLLLENAGEEERYLKSLLSNFRNSLLSIKDELLEDGKPLVEFPRIWMMALSKSDLVPDLDAYKFRDLLIEKAGDDLEELRKVLAGFVEGSDALSVSEDFVLLSSAKFETNKIEVTERVGLDLILPVAAMLPFERHLRWANAKQLPAKVGQNLVNGLGPITAVLSNFNISFKPKGWVGNLVGLVGAFVSREVLEDVAKQAGNKLRDINEAALAKNDYLTATLTGFRMDLEKGELEEILIRSQR